MKNPIAALIGKKPKSTREIEAELAKLRQKLADHQRRRSELLQAAEEARVTWRESLAEEDDVIAAAKANVDRLEHDADEAARVIAEYEAAITGAEERFRAATDIEERRASAQALEKTAAAVDAVAPELEKAVASVTAAIRKLRNAIPKDLGVFEMDSDGRPEERPERSNEYASAREATAAVLAEALLAEIPDLFDFGRVGNRSFVALLAVGQPTAHRIEALAWHGRDDIGLPAAAAVDALISARLRDRATKILAGEIDPKTDTVKIVEPYRAPAPEPETHVFVIRHFKFLDGKPGYKPRYRGASPGSNEYLKDAVAKAAIARKVAVLYDSEEGEKARQLDYSVARGLGHVFGRAAITVPFGPSIDEYYDIGDPLQLQKAFEEAQRADAAADSDVIGDEVARAVG